MQTILVQNTKLSYETNTNWFSHQEKNCHIATKKYIPVHLQHLYAFFFFNNKCDFKLSFNFMHHRNLTDFIFHGSHVNASSGAILI